MIVKTDRFGEETGFHLVDKSTNEKLANFPVGSLQNEKTYTKQVVRKWWDTKEDRQTEILL